MMKELFIGIGFCLLFTTCSTQQQNNTQGIDSTTQSDSNLDAKVPAGTDTAKNRLNLSGAWQMISMPGHPTDWSRTPELVLDVEAGAFTGNTGCNSMSGRFVVEGASVAFDNEIITTKMACTSQYKEQVFLENLLMVNNYSINDSTLQLQQLDTVKMVFKRKLI